jgi:hypothetical protein
MNIPIEATSSGTPSRIMRATALLIAGTLICAACGAPLGPPDYPPPPGVDAQWAFRSAFKTDWVDHPFEPVEPKEVDASNYREFQAYNEQRLANERAIRAFGALQRLEIGECVWERYSLSDISVWSKTRIATDPKAAYRCGFTLHYQINPPYGEPKTIVSEGFFFRQADTYVYAGLFETPY